MHQQFTIAKEPVVSAVTADTTVHAPVKPLYIFKAKKRQQKEIVLKTYYRETYFAKDSMLHPELTGGRSGVAGSPVPYTIHGDNTITAVLLFYFIVTIIISSYSRQAIAHQLKHFFFPPRKENQHINNPIRKFQFFLSILTCLLFAILYYLYTNQYHTDTFLIDTPYKLTTIFFGIFVGFFFCKIFLYNIINAIFFDNQKRRQWIWTLTLIVALEGILLFPAVILQVYVNLALQNVVYYFIFIHILAKLLTFYKCWAIFFREIRDFLQIILYLCALEIVPMLALWGLLILINNELKVTI